ncbi:MAG TPA: endolytic transglycosylase MltG [bacterium]|nr:endolytic transglycosylase MltG [bacterium]
MKKIGILIFLGIMIVLIISIYIPKDSNSQNEKLFSIYKGQGGKEIAINLEKEDLIKNATLFRFYVLTVRNADNLQAGDYFLSSAMTIAEIAGKISSGDVAKVKVTIPEGFNLDKIDKRFKSKNEWIIVPDSFKNELAKDYKDKFEFLNNAPNNATLEGFLFPDTYHFSLRTDINEIALRILNNFNKKLTPDLREEINNQGKTVFQIITMASLIEKEVRTIEDKKLVSGVLWKRLENHIPLQVDATITYITGKESTKVSKKETQIDSPYNTYKYQGLPVGPISNPGIESIKAAIYPENNEYLYYLSTPKGETIFSKTLEEHNTAKAKYLWR